MNGFEDDDISVTRIIDIPDEYEEVANAEFRVCLVDGFQQP